MKRANKCLGVLAALGFAALAGPTHARDWGFTVDTAKQWENPNVALRTGLDTLIIDSVWVEVVEPKDYQTRYSWIGWRFDHSNHLIMTPYWGEGRDYNHSNGEYVSYKLLEEIHWFDPDGAREMNKIWLSASNENGNVEADTVRFLLRTIYRSPDRGTDTLMIAAFDNSDCTPFCPTEVGAPPQRLMRNRVPNLPFGMRPYKANGQHLRLNPKQ